ncbi:hypothetical protein TWF506_008724 [Arthrobotrys conoides]|uniref:Uncharacterized protein n=1 Tax=Arthrobotrys conoides TaxID=74498 RepID=A0AAN8NJK2_9PEZI
MLRSSTAKVWLEKQIIPDGYICPDPRPAPCRHCKYTPATLYLPSKSTQRSSATTYSKPVTFKATEAFIESCPDAYYRIKMAIPRHFKAFCVQVIIDGIEQNAYVETSRCFRNTEYPISARRTRKYAYRHFQFTQLDIKDPCPGAGDYAFKHLQHCENGYVSWFRACGDTEAIDYMIGKKAVGTIRINLYRVKKCKKMTPPENKKMDERDDGDGEWDPCKVVDHIGALKLGAGVENVTKLGPEVRGTKPAQWYSVELANWHPFETFIFKYRPYAHRFQKFTKFIKNIFTFSKKSKTPKGLKGQDEVPEYKEKSV